MKHLLEQLRRPQLEQLRRPQLEPMEDSEEVVHTSVRPPTVEQANRLTEGLTLAGRPLVAPQFHETHWREGQVFTAEDDPDRARQPWEPPSFVRSKNPIAQREKTHVKDVPLHHVSEKMRSTSFARVVHGVLDEEDCADLLASVNQKGYTPALLNIGRGQQKLIPAARDGHRVIVDSPEFTAWLFEVIKPFLPERLGDSELIDLNERCRFLCYTPGQSFPGHCDGRYSRSSGHPHVGDFSQVTIQLYLNDVPSQAGGATNFLHLDETPAFRCQPVAGSVLLFTQDQYHEGELLSAGLKYTLRTEAMYRRPKLPTGPGLLPKRRAGGGS